jgi:hypothetical protein
VPYCGRKSRWIEKSNDHIGNRHRDLPSCRIVPQPTTLPHIPFVYVLSCNQVCSLIFRACILGSDSERCWRPGETAPEARTVCRFITTERWKTYVRWIRSVLSCRDKIRANVKNSLGFESPSGWVCDIWHTFAICSHSAVRRDVHVCTGNIQTLLHRFYTASTPLDSLLLCYASKGIKLYLINRTRTGTGEGN